MAKSKLTFVIPQSLKQELSERIISDGYGFRGKSKWVVEAIKSLFEDKNYPDLVNINDCMSGFEVSETVVVDQVLKRSIESAIIDIRKQYPALDGVQSGIIRTAIIQRLLRPKILSQNISLTV